MLPTEIQNALEMLEQARQYGPLIGMGLLAVPVVAVAVQVLGRWTFGGK